MPLEVLDLDGTIVSFSFITDKGFTTRPANKAGQTQGWWRGFSNPKIAWISWNTDYIPPYQLHKEESEDKTGCKKNRYAGKCFSRTISMITKTLPPPRRNQKEEERCKNLKIEKLKLKRVSRGGMSFLLTESSPLQLSGKSKAVQKRELMQKSWRTF